MEPAIATLCADELRREDVTVIKYTRDIGPFYRSADVFAFPSLEEGGPQVTYEAAGCGLPLLTSPMGAARIGIHGSTGLVVDPRDEGQWIEAMQELARDPDLRHRMGQAARQRAQDFTWPKVAADSRDRVLENCEEDERRAALAKSGAIRGLADPGKGVDDAESSPRQSCRAIQRPSTADLKQENL